DAARRETLEEAGLDLAGPWVALYPVLSVPVNITEPSLRRHWPGWLTTIPCYPFAVWAADAAIRLSAEHSEFRWASLDAARGRVRWDTDRAALDPLVRTVAPVAEPPHPRPGAPNLGVA